MAKLPTRDTLGGLPSARSGRVIASYDTSAAGRGLADLGASIAGAATDIARIGGATGSGGGARVSQAEQFEAQRKFLEFTSAQEQAYEESKNSVDPGAFGFREFAQENYKKAATEFFKTIPAALKPEYDMKLFQAEDNFLTKARAFETAARTKYYGDEVNKGLGTLENKLFSNPGDFDKNYSEGVSFINAIPDESLSRIQKADLVKGWRKKAQLASLNGVTPQERIRLLGGAPNQPGSQPSAARGQSITRGISGDIRKTISDAAAAYGVDPEALLTIAWIESRGNPNAKNPNSSAGGLFQFIDSTARGYGLQNKFDPAQSADAAARLTRDNSAALEQVLGRKPTTGELYLAHQQGSGGAIKLLSNPNAKAVDVVGADAVRLNGGTSDMTAGQFASLWTKKAGDTHVPDGGLMNAQFDASRADPRFADMNYEDAQQIIGGAQKEISASITMAERAATESAARATAAAKAAQAQANDEYRLRIATNDPSITEQEILDDARIDNGDKATLINSYQAAQKENAGVNEFIQTIATGGVSVNPFNADQTKVADKAFEKMMGAADEEQVGPLVGEFAAKSGYVPKRVQADLRRGSASTDTEDVARAMQMADVLQNNAPISFNNFEGGGDVRKNLDLYRTYTEGMGLSPEEAAQKIIDLKDPEKIRQRDAILKSEPITKALKAVSASDVAAIFDKGFFSAAPDVGGVAGPEAVKVGVNTEAEAAIVADYRGILEESLADTNGDMDAAKDLAKSRFEKNYGTSQLSPLGSSVVLKYPPEKAYPAINGSHDYLRDQAIEALKAEGVEADEIYLQAYDRTEVDIRGGKPAHYQLFYRDEKGLQRFFLPFYAVPEAANTAAKVKQAERFKEAEARMFDNRDRFANERAADQRSYDETQGPDWMKAQQMQMDQERRRQDETLEQLRGPNLGPINGGGGGGW